MRQYLNNFSETDKGFSLIELLVVLAILGALSAVIVPNVGKFASRTEPSISEEADCIIYVTEAGLQKQIGTITLGKMFITFPQKMSIDESAEILLRLEPSQDISENVGLTYSSTGMPSLYYEVTDVVRLYPVMFAELKAPNFRIDSGAGHYRALSMEAANDWSWLISPVKSGKQLISIQLLSPVQVRGYEQQVARAVYSQSFEVFVSEPMNWGLFALGLGSFGAFLGGLAAILTKIRQRRSGGDKRKSKMAGRRITDQMKMVHNA